MTFRFLLPLVTAAMVSTAAGAATLVPNVWTGFFFGATGSSITDNVTNDTTYDFTLTKAATLQVTDAYIPGDIFQISDGATVLGTTSTPAGGSSFTTDPDVAYADPNYSHGTYQLAAGAHSISGIVTASPVGSGGAFIELVSGTIPEPAAWALMVAGFGVVGTASRRRRAAVVA